MGEAVSDVDDPDVGRPARRRWSNPWPDQPLWVSVAAWVGVLSPLVAAVIWASRHPFLPGRDRALMELQAMDVFTRDTPLVGVWSRLGWHHPGPWPVWIMAGPYHLLDPSHSLLLAAAIVNLGAVVVLVAVVRRAMPSWMGLVSCVVLLAVLHSFGGTGLADPWNPWIAVVPALVASVAAALAFERFWFGLVAIVGAAFTTQAHVGYLPIMGLTTLVALFWLVAPMVRGTRPSRTPLRIVAIVGVVLVAWGPVLVEQVVHDPGNLTLLVDDAVDPPPRLDIDGQPMRRVTVGEAVDLVAHEFSPDATFLATPHREFDDVASSRWWLLVPLGCVALGAALWRRGTVAARRYLVVSWLQLGVMALGFSRLFGVVLPYQLMSGTVVGFSLLTATAWMAGCAVVTTDRRRVALRWVALAAVAVLAVASISDLRSVAVPEQRLSDIGEVLVPDTIDRLQDAGITEVAIEPALIPWLDWAMEVGLRRQGLSRVDEDRAECVVAVRQEGDPVPEGWTVWSTWTAPDDDAATGTPLQQFIDTRGSMKVLAGPGCGEP